MNDTSIIHFPIELLSMDLIWVFVSSQDWEEASCSDIAFIALLSLKFWMTPTLSSFNSVLRRNNNPPRSGALLALGSNWLHDNSIIFATRVQFCFASCYFVYCLRVLSVDLGSILGSVQKPKFTFWALEGEICERCFVIYDWSLFV